MKLVMKMPLAKARAKARAESGDWAVAMARSGGKGAIKAKNTTKVSTGINAWFESGAWAGSRDWAWSERSNS